MEFRTLGGTGLRVSVLGVGTWQLSGPLQVDGRPDGFPDPGAQEVIRLIQACADLGINLVDCAEIYGDGEGERRVGEAIRERRDEWLVCTKFGLRRGTAGERVVDPRPEAIRPSLEASLRRLRTDRVDVYLYHAPPRPDSVAAGADVLASLKREGKLRFCGISGNDRESLLALLACGAADVALFKQSLLTHDAGLLEVVKARSLGALVRGALEAGRLSGRYFRSPPQLGPDDSRQLTFRRTDLGRYSAYERLLPAGTPMSGFALRYLLDFETTHSIVLGGRSLGQYQEAVRALDLSRLDPAAHEAIRALRPRLGQRPLVERILERLDGWRAARRSPPR
jgi:aryl-alcohol dehydrogenase-like predicted oxidoreductase